MKKYKLLENYTDEFIKIIDFYVFNCPVKFSNGNKVSQKADLFEKRNISGNKLTKLLNKIKSKNDISIVFLNKNKVVNKNEKKDITVQEIEENNKQIKNIIKEIEKKNYIVLYENKDIGKCKSIFYYIRNSLAHGDFEIKGKRISGCSCNKSKINGEYKIETSKLIEWIDLINNFK